MKLFLSAAALAIPLVKPVMGQPAALQCQDLHNCMEVVGTCSDDGLSVEYCLQPRVDAVYDERIKEPSVCKIGPSFWSHINVWVDGEDVSGTATGCDSVRKPCSPATKQSCDQVDIEETDDTGAFITIGAKCDGGTAGPLCVTVDRAADTGLHAKVVFAIKDAGSCAGGSIGINDGTFGCSPSGDNNCACSGGGACVTTFDFNSCDGGGPEPGPCEDVPPPECVRSSFCQAFCGCDFTPPEGVCPEVPARRNLAAKTAAEDPFTHFLRF